MRTLAQEPEARRGVLLWRRLRCSLEGHDPARHPLGGFRCSRCGKSGADLDAFGFDGEGYVSETARRRVAVRREDGNRAA
jgi:hypothetical protein